MQYDTSGLEPQEQRDGSYIIHWCLAVKQPQPLLGDETTPRIINITQPRGYKRRRYCREIHGSEKSKWHRLKLIFPTFLYLVIIISYLKIGHKFYRVHILNSNLSKYRESGIVRISRDRGENNWTIQTFN